MKRVSLFFLILATVFSFVTTRSSAQSTWARTYDAGGGGGAADVRQTSDGGFLAAGWTKASPTSYTDMWLVRLDPSGNIVWQQSYGGAGRDEIYKLHPTPDGGFIGIGLSSSFGANQHAPLVLKFDGNGNVQWQKTYLSSGRDWGFDIVQTSDGGYIIPGMTDPCACGGTTQGTIIKTDATGNIQWQKIYTGQSTFNSIRQTADGGYIMGGATVSFGTGGGDALVLKLDSNGNIQWQNTYGGGSYDAAVIIQLTSDGGYILGGSTQSFGSGGTDAWLVKLNADGSIAWQRAYGGAGYDDAQYIEQTADGGYIVSGQTNTAAVTGTDLWVFKIDQSGNLVWQRSYDSGSPSDVAFAAHPTSDGGYVVAGFSDPGCPFGCVPPPTPQRFTVLKLKSDGTVDPSCSSGVGAMTNAVAVNTSATILAGPISASAFGASANTTNVTVTSTNGQPTTICASGSTPVTHTLTVASTNPSSGVGISVSLLDNNNLSDGTTLFARIYNSGVVVTLTAQTTSSGNNFSNWIGCDSTSGTTCTVTMTGDRAVTANYMTPLPPIGTINVSTNTASATYIITGPATFSGTGASSSFSNVPTGAYTIKYGPSCRSDLPASSTMTLAPGGTINFVGTYVPGFLTFFPLAGFNPCTALINSVFDHSATYQYCADGTVTAYTGETGQQQFGSSRVSTFFCQLTQDDNDLFGFSQADGTHFSLHGQYGGAGQTQYLFYDGHPGYDYRASCHTPVYAAASGTIRYPNSIPGANNAQKFHVLEIDPDSPNESYKLYYLHLSTYVKTSCPSCKCSPSLQIIPPGAHVNAGDLIGEVGDAGVPGQPHLHFEVQMLGLPANSKGVPVDPYGWQATGSDPYAIRAKNVNLWK